MPAIGWRARRFYIHPIDGIRFAKSLEITPSRSEIFAVSSM